MHIINIFLKKKKKSVGIIGQITVFLIFGYHLTDFGGVCPCGILRISVEQEFLEAFEPVMIQIVAKLHSLPLLCLVCRIGDHVKRLILPLSSAYASQIYYKKALVSCHASTDG